MRWILTSIVLVVISLIAIPAIVVRGVDYRTVPYRPAKAGEGVMIKVYLHEQKEIKEINLEDYVKSVVAAEMPAEFDMEALKAQAVAARTYAARNMLMYGGAGSLAHPGADISTAVGEGQAWVDEQTLKNRWGENKYSLYWYRISRAVDETRGLVLTYNGEMINALFHSTSGGQTEDPSEVWGQQTPYLKSVACPWDQNSPRYKAQKQFTVNEIEALLGPDAGVITVAKNGQADLVQIIEKTSSGRVKKVRIGSKVFDGVDVREKLGLHSTNFTWTFEGDQVRFSTTGYGHGVGLSQYGANGLAKEGKSYKDILHYFYQGVQMANVYGG